MADAPATKPGAAPAISRLRDPQFREIYTNASFTGLTPFDITITFSRASDFSGQTVHLDQVAVTMSPQHFKGFCKSLNETMTAYESVFGALQIPDSDTRPLTDASQIEAMILETRRKNEELRQPTSKLLSSPTEKKRPSRRSRGAARE
jgi:hypothetical protein